MWFKELTGFHEASPEKVRQLLSIEGDSFRSLLGGGAFGNRSEWIYDAMKMALLRFSHYPFDIAIVSYRESKPETLRFVKSILAAL